MNDEERKLKQIRVKESVYEALKEKAKAQDITLEGGIEKAFLMFIESEKQE